MIALIIITILTAISSIFLAVGDKQKLKRLKLNSITVIGGVASSIAALMVNFNSNEQKKNIEETKSTIIAFEGKLDSLKNQNVGKEEILKFDADYEKWASQIKANLEIKDLKKKQELAIEAESKISNRLPITTNLNSFISSINNYANAYNSVTNQGLDYEFPNMLGTEDQSLGLIRGTEETYLLTFEYDSKCSRQNQGQITFQVLPNKELDQYLNRMNSSDTINSALQYLAFELRLVTLDKVIIGFDLKKNIIRVNEFNREFVNKIFEKEYDLTDRPRTTIDIVVKTLIEEILYKENKANTV